MADVSGTNNIKNNNDYNKSNTAVNCVKCRYFYVTWDPKFPRGCKQFGFKTIKLPSYTVLEATGNPCGSYIEK